MTVSYRAVSVYCRARSVNSTNNFRNVNNNGNSNNNNANNTYGVALGFFSVCKESAQEEKERQSFVRKDANKRDDRIGRTLLAWYRLTVILYFMPGILMQLHVTVRQLYVPYFYCIYYYDK